MGGYKGGAGRERRDRGMGERRGKRGNQVGFMRKTERQLTLLSQMATELGSQWNRTWKSGFSLESAARSAKVGFALIRRGARTPPRSEGLQLELRGFGTHAS